MIDFVHKIGSLTIGGEVNDQKSGNLAYCSSKYGDMYKNTFSSQKSWIGGLEPPCTWGLKIGRCDRLKMGSNSGCYFDLLNVWLIEGY